MPARHRSELTDSAGNSIGTTTFGGAKSLNVSLSPTLTTAGTVTYPTSTQEVYAFRQGSTSGTILATLTINYTDNTKASILNWAWS